MTDEDKFVGFDAVNEIDDFSYRIPEKWGGDGEVHEIPEPSQEMIARFWADYATMVQVGRTTDTPAPENETDEQRDERLAREIAEGQHRSMKFLDDRCKLLGALCSVDADQLRALPYRVLNAFEGYVIGKLSPEAKGAASSN